MIGYQEVRRHLPADAYLSCTFGYAGVGGYSEFWRTPDGERWEIRNGSYLESAPFHWTLREVQP
jgi:hypothetical protein